MASLDCPCGAAHYTDCCRPYHEGLHATQATLLMRSRYSAYVLRLEDYLLDTWHPRTRPDRLDLTNDQTRWLGLQIKHQTAEKNTATVEFIARYKISGRAYRLHEISQFVFEQNRWFYLEGIFPERLER